MNFVEEQQNRAKQKLKSFENHTASNETYKITLTELDQLIADAVKATVEKGCEEIEKNESYEEEIENALVYMQGKMDAQQALQDIVK